MTREDIIHLAKECSSAVYELCLNNSFFNTTECPIGANGLSDVVLNAVLNAFPKTQELASIQQPQGLDEAAEKASINYLPKERGEAIDSNGDVYETDDVNWPDRVGFRNGFKAGAKWDSEQGEIIEGMVSAIGNNRWVDLDDKQLDEQLSSFKDGDEIIVQIRKKQ